MKIARLKNKLSNFYFPPFLKDIDYTKIIYRAKYVVRAFYYFLAFYSIVIFGRLDSMKELSTFDASWPIAWWTQYFNYSTVVIIVQFAFLLSAFAAAIFYKNVWPRVFVFIAYVQVFAFINSFTSVIHNWYHLLYVLFFLMFLPNIWKKQDKDRSLSFLTLFWGAQAFVLLSYSMAGIGKVIGAIKQFISGDLSLFSPQSASLLIAYWSAQREQIGMLTEWVITHPVAGWITLLLFVYVLFVSIVVAFRPRLHVVWGVLLVLFHLGTYLTVGIFFEASVGILIFLLWFSPFVPDSLNIKEVLRDIPFFGDIWNAFRRV